MISDSVSSTDPDAPKPDKAPPRVWWTLGALVGFCLLTVWIWTARQANLRDRPPELGPVVLAMQKIGELHTASFTMKDVVPQETQVEPEGIASKLPIVPEVYHWATRNEALIVVEGTVDAGVDLSRLTAKDVTAVKRADGTTAWRVRLPPVTLYPPNVHPPRVERNESGLLWRDENIVPKAQEKAARRFQEAAEKSGIRQQAQKNAIETLQTMQHALGRDVEFYF